MKRIDLLPSLSLLSLLIVVGVLSVSSILDTEVYVALGFTTTINSSSSPAFASSSSSTAFSSNTFASATVGATSTLHNRSINNSRNMRVQLKTTKTRKCSSSSSSKRNILRRFSSNNDNSNEEIDGTETEAKTGTETEKDTKIKRLTNNPLRLAVLRLGMTELRGTSRYNYINGKKDGDNSRYDCGYCGATLFESNAKYDSGSGWPSFWRSVNENSIAYKMEFDGRMECKCSKCDSHLGHVFMDGPYESSVNSQTLKDRPLSDPTSKYRNNGRLPRFCINGACLDLKEE